MTEYKQMTVEDWEKHILKSEDLCQRTRHNFLLKAAAGHMLSSSEQNFLEAWRKIVVERPEQSKGVV